MAEISREYEKNCLMEDIDSKAEELFPEKSELSYDKLKTIAQMVDSFLSKNDGYWESYWDSVEMAIKEYFKEVGC